MILSCEMVRENENGLVQFSYSHLRNELIDNLLVTSSRTLRETLELQQKWKQLKIYKGHLLDIHFTA